MSTSPISSPAAAHAAPLRLRRVTTQPAQLARIPFLVMLSIVLVGGMVGVLILNTIIQGQSQTLRAAQSQAATLANEQAALQTQVDQLRSVTYLQQAASALGMRPDPQAAVLNLATGKVSGTPTPASGEALPDQVWHGAVVQPAPPQISIVPPPQGTTSAAPPPAASVPSMSDGSVEVAPQDPAAAASAGVSAAQAAVAEQGGQ